MEEYITLFSVPAVSAIVYWIINLIKYTTNNNEKVKRFIPLMSAGLGVVIAIIAFYAAPGIVPASNVFVAAVVGGASGLSATGANQVIKQLTKSDSDSENKQ